jgi:hypothetical protein
MGALDTVRRELQKAFDKIHVRSLRIAGSSSSSSSSSIHYPLHGAHLAFVWLLFREAKILKSELSLPLKSTHCLVSINPKLSSLSQNLYFKNAQNVSDQIWKIRLLSRNLLLLEIR